MTEQPYSRFQDNVLILRDELAIDRTLLANERTLLAYLRSGVALFIAGASMMHFSQEGWFWFIGLVSIPIGFLAAIVGVFRYARMNAGIVMVRKRNRQTLAIDKGKPTLT